MTNAYRRPGVSVTNLTAQANGRQETGLKIGIIAKGDNGIAVESYDVVRSAATDATPEKESVATSMIDARVSYKGYNYTKDVDFDITSGGEIDWSANTVITPPYLLSVERATGASMVPAGTYYYRVVAIKCNDELTRSTPNSWGGTTPSNEKAITIADPAAIKLKWIEVPQAEGYRIYRNGSLLTTVLGETDSFLDIGVYTPSLTPGYPFQLSAITGNTAYRKPPYSKAAVAGYLQGGAVTGVNFSNIISLLDAQLDVNFDGLGIIQMRNMGFTSILAAATGVDIARYAEYYISNKSGTYSKFYGGDVSLNFAALKAVTATNPGRLAIVGSNLCLNGDFGLRYNNTNAENWTIGTDWIINANRQAVHSAGAGSDTLVSSFSPINGAKYRVTFTIDNFVSGGGNGVRVEVGGTNGTWRTATGTYTEDIVAGAGGSFLFRADTLDACTISNVSVRRVYETADIDLSTANTLTDVATLIQSAIRAIDAEFSNVLVNYNTNSGAFEITSSYRGTDGRISAESPSTAIDLAAPNYLNFTSVGYEIRGVPSAARVSIVSDVGNDYFRITSPTTGAQSSVVITPTSSPANDLAVATHMNLLGSTPVSGVSGINVVYNVQATISGGNFFAPEYIFTVSDAAEKFGETSDMTFYVEKVLLAPPSGNGGHIVVATAVPAMDRSTAQAALIAQEAIRTELSTIITDDIDIIRDHYGHCMAMSTPQKSMWRVGLAMCRKTMSVANLVSLAAELNSPFYGIIWDNISQDDNISPYIAARLAAMPSLSDSIINQRIYFDNGLLSKPRYDKGTIDYLLANGVMVLDYNDDGVPCIIDDVMTAGSQYDLTGAITDTFIKYGLKSIYSPLIGKIRINSDGLLALKVATQNYLDSVVSDLIDSYDKSSVVVVRSNSDRYKAVVRFSYYRIYTLKRVDVEYYVI